MSSAWNAVRGCERVSLCDWPGRVAAVLFVAGCPWRCPTCHNAALAWHAHLLAPLDREATLADLRRRRMWLDGLVVSGGEPTAAPELEALLEDVARLGLPVKLDTNGSDPARLEALLASGLVDTVAVDVKGPWWRYPELTGAQVTPEAVEAHFVRIFALAKRAPQRFLFRCTRVPQLTEADLAQVRRQVPEMFPIHWQEYIPPRRVPEENEYAQTDSQA
ncbi:anaerobic ribonucleoside-triphosphate reductase activating protein [Thermodesulfomicrobium sp. WS]|uniref:anaerobic ribonucleoside-triphosphate reductase activating protein n=1 Tax=Thermodesulfomicrobium sp. WS TaxID=3004129 RepID=UPI002491FDD6|nr:anaerobic ribonucleoside-triphosphate reductase activating protein [Thermodesulfomicrobium sp. WS]BDV01892.1 anaerobic ribonucleoside-triphosphate reductase activating protein [Thermodesulfomicrobium sp. WS]